MRAAMGNANSHYCTIEVPPIMPKAKASTGKRALRHREYFETKQIPISTLRI